MKNFNYKQYLKEGRLFKEGKLEKNFADLEKSVSRMGDIDTEISKIKSYINNKHPDLNTEIKGAFSNQIYIFNNSPETKVVHVQIGGDGNWDIFVATSNEYHTTTEDMGKYFSNPDQTMLDYIDLKIQQYL